MSEPTHEIIAPATPAPPVRLHPAIAQILDALGTTDADTIDKLGALFDLQRQHEADEARRAYTRALVTLQRDLPRVLDRNERVEYGTTKYQHTSLAAVLDAVGQPLADNGFALSWRSETPERNVVLVTAVLTHCDGHSETCSLPAPPDTSGHKNPAQAVASTVTLLSRYTALSLLGIATRDMPEPKGRDRGGDDAERVDVACNQRVASRLAAYGRSISDAERHLGGRPIAKWTGADLLALRAWLQADADGADGVSTDPADLPETPADAEKPASEAPTPADAIEDPPVVDPAQGADFISTEEALARSKSASRSKKAAKRADDDDLPSFDDAPDDEPDEQIVAVRKAFEQAEFPVPDHAALARIADFLSALNLTPGKLRRKVVSAKGDPEALVALLEKNLANLKAKQQDGEAA